MIRRRTFIKSAAATGAALALGPMEAFSRLAGTTTPGFTVHPFVETHPDAVFVLRTAVDKKTNSAAIHQVGLTLGRSVFVPCDVADGGIPLTRRIVIKPNLTCRGKWDNRYTIENSMGVQTDANFVEGMIGSLKELGFAGQQFFLREVNCPEDFGDGGYWSMAARTGADLRNLSTNVELLPEEEVQWVNTPAGEWFTRIPFLWPVNAPDTWLLNIAKFKAHAMGLTLCAKNLQGTIAANYQQHCTHHSDIMDIRAEHIRPGAKEQIWENFERHQKAGYPRWDRPGGEGGIWQETWATRCLDTNAVTHAGLHVIEGVYGRDGHFIAGPGPGDIATDYMSNIVVFGKNPFHVDIIGHYLGGHEPGNFGLFHMALERGLLTFLNPRSIPLYEWHTAGTATLTPLADMPRTPLETLYLQRDYNGQTETYWHLVDEPYTYATTEVADRESMTPDAFVLYQNYPNPFNGSTIFQFSIPRSGRVTLDVHTLLGDVVDVVAEGPFAAGSHMAVWQSRHHASGIYFYRLRFDGQTATRRMLLIK